MKPNTILQRMVVMLITLMCALGANAQQAYACYTPSDKTLTFYYDNNRSSHRGTTYDLNTGTNDPGWVTDNTNVNVTNVVFAPSFAKARPQTTYKWFFYMALLRTIKGMNNLNTSAVTNMAWMFRYCSSTFFTTLDLSSFNTSKVTNMSYMFSECSSLETLDLSNLNTSNVTNMSNMFSGCISLTTLDLSSFNTSKVTYMNSMFNGCRNLQTIYVGSGWSTGDGTFGTKMFTNCTSLVGGKGTKYNSNHVEVSYAHIDTQTNPGYLTDVTTRQAYACYTSSNTTLTFYCDARRSSREGTTYDLNTGTNDPGWVTDNINANVTKVAFDLSFGNVRPTTTYKWFYSMGKLQALEGMSNLNTSEVTNMSNMFYHCKLTSLELSHFNTANVTDMSMMFFYCNDLTTLDLSSFNTSKVSDMSKMFSLCHDLRTIYVGSAWSTDAVTNSDLMFDYCDHLIGGKLTGYNYYHKDKEYAHIDGGSSNPGYFTDPNGPEAYACYTTSNTTLTFYYDTQRRSREGTIYVLNVDDNLPDWVDDDTNTKVTKVVFDPSFANARPTTTYYWFIDMRSLQTIEGLRYLNTSEVTNMSYMFAACKLTSLDLSHFSTANVIDMSCMFCYCEQLESLDLSSFNTSNVTDMTLMFSGCSSLTSLDLSSFNTANVTDMSDMFGECANLQTIYAGSGWSTDAVTISYGMFSNCTNLVGGKGTTYNDDHIDKTYARIDGEAGKRGYFTKGSEAYAVYKNGTLTFYYDSQRDSHTVTYDLNTDNTSPGWFTDFHYLDVTKVVFDPTFANTRPTSTYSWFLGMSYLQTIEGMGYLNTSEVTNMSSMFYGCKLKSLDLSHFNTANVTDMIGMFDSCSELTSLDLSSFNTAKVTSMSTMFRDCKKLVTVYVGDDWSTTKVTSSSSMFQNCTSLKGGQGTTYNANYPSDKTYAHIDGEGGMGYFTYKKPSGITTGVAMPQDKVQSSSHSEAAEPSAKFKVQSNAWYTIDGRKLNGVPTKKGIYIHNGNKQIIK
ncbi:MAG: BspA family leucine-rich repeat surface protein [Prevotella sp.]|nr:BspA family leucine-rich repeat surface protein [Prevotella sp.]